MMHLLPHFIAAGFGISAQDIGINGGPTNIYALTATITKILLMFIGMISGVMIIVGGLQIVLAAGNPQRFKQGRETVLYAVVGLVVAIAAYAIVTFIAAGIS